MGLCQCVNQDNTAQKTVDIATLKNDLHNNLDKEPKTSLMIIKDKTSDISPISEISIKEEKGSYLNLMPKDTDNIENNSNRNQIKIKAKPHSIQKQSQINDSSNNNSNNNKPTSNTNSNQLTLLQANANAKAKSNDDLKRYSNTKMSELRFLNRTYINIVILGGKDVGKSAFVIKFIENTFEKLYIPTLGVEVRRKKYSFNTHLYDLNFTVTSGNDYKSDYSKAYQEVDFFLVFYDITSMESFNEAKKILNSDVKNYVYCYNPTISNVFLIGNKIDCSPRSVPEEAVKSFCEQNDFQMFDISVKTNKNIAIMMKALMKTVDDVAYPSLPEP